MSKWYYSMRPHIGASPRVGMGNSLSAATWGFRPIQLGWKDIDHFDFILQSGEYVGMS